MKSQWMSEERMGEVRDKKAMELGSRAGWREGDAGHRRGCQDSRARVGLQKGQQRGSPQRKCVRFQMCVYRETVHPRESSEHVLKNKGLDEKDKRVQGEMGPRTEEEWLARGMSGKGRTLANSR